MKFRCGSPNCRLINTREKKSTIIRKYGKQIIEMTKEIHATYLTKPKCIPSKKNGFGFTKYLYSVFLLIE